MAAFSIRRHFSARSRLDVGSVCLERRQFLFTGLARYEAGSTRVSFTSRSKANLYLRESSQSPFIHRKNTSQGFFRLRVRLGTGTCKDTLCLLIMQLVEYLTLSGLCRRGGNALGLLPNFNPPGLCAHGRRGGGTHLLLALVI